MRHQVRARILKKYNHTCAACGSTEDLEIDHIIPLSRGGWEDEENMQVLCRTCNRSKSDKVDYSQFFIIDESLEYIKIAKKMTDMIPYLGSKQFASICAAMFMEHDRYWYEKEQGKAI